MNRDIQAKATDSTRKRKRSEKLLRLRGEGVIYDVIDELLAPLMARWIAMSDYAPLKDQNEIVSPE